MLTICCIQCALLHSPIFTHQFSGTQNELFDLIDTNNDGELSKDEIIAAAPLLGMSQQEAAHYFDTLSKGSTSISRKGFGGDLVESVSMFGASLLGTLHRQGISPQEAQAPPEVRGTLI